MAIDLGLRAVLDYLLDMHLPVFSWVKISAYRRRSRDASSSCESQVDLFALRFANYIPLPGKPSYRHEPRFRGEDNQTGD